MTRSSALAAAGVALPPTFSGSAGLVVPSGLGNTSAEIKALAEEGVI
jgi:hypothetical protein